VIELAADAVHVWFAPIGDDDLSADEPLLAEDERARWARLVSPRDQRGYLAARALLRRTLSRYADVDPRAWSFVTTGAGRPELAPGSCALPLSFSLSRTDGLALCAVALDRAVGADVERRRSDVDPRVLGLDAGGLAAFHALPAAEQAARFHDRWTLLEAYAKARGGGLPLLDEVRIDDRLDDAWRSLRFDPTPAHRAAVVAAAPARFEVLGPARRD
jgi:4'-phosphopantetheinyl transferase